MSFIINPYRYASSGISSPEDVAGLVIWFDGTDTSYMYQTYPTTTAVSSNDDPVGDWINKASGGAGESMQTATAGQRGTYKTSVQNGLSAIYADSDYLQTDASMATYWSGDWSLFAVYSQTTDQTENQGLVISSEGNNSGAARLYADTRASPRRVIGIASSQWVSLISEQAPKWEVKCGVFDADAGTYGTVEGFLDGVSQGTVAGTAGLAAGSSACVFAAGAGTAPFKGWIGEILLYSSALSTTDRQSVEAYLAAKWAI
jgi:hypothetical protein